GDQCRVGGRKLPLGQEQIVLEPDAYVGAHRRRHGAEGDLHPSRRQHRPVILVSEQPLGGVAHHHDILRLGPDAAQDSKNRLYEKRWLDELAVEEMRERIKMPHIIAFEFEAHPMAFAQSLQYLLYISKSITENEVPRSFEMVSFPFVLEVAIALQHGIQSK